ncbi:MAG: hypothetical protein ACYCPN_01965 [Thermoplasmata archaeon]
MAMQKVGGGRRSAGAILAVVAFVILIAALFVPWYSFSESASGPYFTGSQTTNFYIGNGSNSVQFTCTGNQSCPSSTNYGNVSGTALTKTGQDSVLLQYVVIGAIVVGALGAIMAFAGRHRPGRGRAAIALLVVACLITIAAPITQMAVQPGALHSDLKSSGMTNGAGPWNSFFGSNKTTHGPETVTTTWGPSTGWYLAFGAFVLFLVGAILSTRREKGPSPVAAPATGTPGPVMAPPGPPPS